MVASAALIVMTAPEVRAEGDVEGDGEARRAVTAQACNYTGSSVYVALGHYDDLSGWLGSGWWHLSPGFCTDLGFYVSHRQPIYMYAQSEGGRRFVPREGYPTRRFCIAESVWSDWFTYTREDCQDNWGVRLQRFGRVVDSDRDGYAVWNIDG